MTRWYEKCPDGTCRSRIGRRIKTCSVIWEMKFVNRMNTDFPAEPSWQFVPTVSHQARLIEVGQTFLQTSSSALLPV